MANQVFVDIVFRKDKKSDLIKKTEKEAGKAGAKAGQQFGKGFNRNVKAQVSGVNNLFNQMRKNVVSLAGGFLVFRGITSAITGAFNSMREFSKSIAEVNSILPKNTKLTKDSIDTFSRFAGQFGSSSAAQTKAFYSIVSAGVRGTVKQLNTLKVANQAAVAGLVDINTASRSLVSSVNAYAKSGLTAQQASDSLFVAVREGQTTFGELADFLGNTSAIASSAGVSFDELTGTVSALTKGGIETSKATIALRGVITSLIKPSDDAKKAAKTLGLEFGVAAIRSKGLVGFLKDVADKTGGSTVALGKLFGNVRGLSGVLKLVNGDFADFKRIVEATQNSTGATSEAFREVKKSIDFDITRLTSEIKAFGEQLLITSQGPMKTFITGARQIFKALTPDTRDKSILELAREELKKITPELNRVTKSLLNQAGIQKQIRASGNKDIEKNLIARQASLRKAREKQLAIIKAFSKQEVENDKSKEMAKTEAAKLADNKRAANSVNALLKAKELNVLSIEDVRETTSQKLSILEAGNQAELLQLENKGLVDTQLKEQAIALETEHQERKAQIIAAAAAQQEQILNTTAAVATTGIFGMTKALNDMGVNAVKIGSIVKKGLGDVVGNSFQAMGQAMKNGGDAFGAFKDAVQNTLAGVASAMGDVFIQQGVGFTILGDPRGPALIGVGAGLKLLAGFMGTSGSSAGATSAVGGGGGAISGGIDPIEASIAEPEIQESGPRVALTIEGNMFDTDDTRKSIVEFLNESFSEDGASLDNASFA